MQLYNDLHRKAETATEATYNKWCSFLAEPQQGSQTRHFFITAATKEEDN
jgi:hypothetical protein